MTDNNRKPEQQQNDPARQSPGQQQQQGQPRQNEPGRNPGGQAGQAETDEGADRSDQVRRDDDQRTDR